MNGSVDWRLLTACKVRANFTPWPNHEVNFALNQYYEYNEYSEIVSKLLVIHKSNHVYEMYIEVKYAIY